MTSGKTRQPWGTILKPDFELGHQKSSAKQVREAVNRLYYIPKFTEVVIKRQNKKISLEEYRDMIERLSKPIKVPDSDRRVRSSMCSSMGIMGSYAWQGYGRLRT